MSGASFQKVPRENEGVISKHAATPQIFTNFTSLILVRPYNFYLSEGPCLEHVLF